jgi:hypothetical protein
MCLGFFVNPRRKPFCSGRNSTFQCIDDKMLSIPRKVIVQSTGRSPSHDLPAVSFEHTKANVSSSWHESRPVILTHACAVAAVLSATLIKSRRQYRHRTTRQRRCFWNSGKENEMHSLVPLQRGKNLTISIVGSLKKQYACKHMCLNFLLFQIRL